jgi:predicted aldo/keto reductase-like oxidoreductase
MDAYNQKLLHAAEAGDSKQIRDRLAYHWSVEASEAGRCTECEQCEDACTQHLDIMSRLREISALA